MQSIPLRYGLANLLILAGIVAIACGGWPIWAVLAGIYLLGGPVDEAMDDSAILLKPTAQAQRVATEASLALINSAFRWHTIDGITAQVAVEHKVGERLVKTLGYARGADIAPSGDRGARTSWSISRETWAATAK